MKLRVIFWALLCVLVLGISWWTYGTGKSQLVRLLNGHPVEISSATWKSPTGTVVITAPEDRSALAAVLRSAQRDWGPPGPTTGIQALTLTCSFGMLRTIEVSVYVVDGSSLSVYVPLGPIKALLSRSDLDMWGVPPEAAQPVLQQIRELLDSP